MKKAYLVTFSICTRVIVSEENDNEESILAAAVQKVRADPDGYIIGDNIPEYEDDHECPYDPETDELPNDNIDLPELTEEEEEARQKDMAMEQGDAYDAQ